MPNFGKFFPDLFSLSAFMAYLCYRVLSERYLPSEIDIVKWNPKFDLLAIATKRGDVILQRLFWKKAWQISAKNAGDDQNFGDVSIRGLSWSPNGKSLAVVYSNGKIIFVDVETGRVCHQIDDESDEERHERKDFVSKWAEAKDLSKKPSIDDDADFLLSLPAMEKSKTSRSSDVSAADSLEGGNPSLFVVNNGRDRFRLFLNGFFHVADLDLSQFVSSASRTTPIDDRKIRPVAVDVSSNFERLGALFSALDTEIGFAIFDTPLASNGIDYWLLLAKRVVQLSTTLQYVESAVQKIVESWEDAVAELDGKLTKYAVSKASSSETIGDDFIQMLVFGLASPELESFLSRTLTDKNLKKLSNSIENLYGNLFGSLGVNLDRGISALYHYLTTLRNLMADDADSTWTEAIDAAADLALKVTSMYDAAETNARSIGLFVRWLHRCSLNVAFENLPSNLATFSDEDLDAVAKFIEDNFCKTIGPFPDDADVPSTAFDLDKLSRLLKPAANDLGVGANSQPLPESVATVSKRVEKVLKRLSIIFSQRFKLIESPVLLRSGGLDAEKLVSTSLLVHDAPKRCFRVVYAVNGDDELWIGELNDRTSSLVASWKLTSVGLVRNVVNLDLYNVGTVTALVQERGEKEDNWRYVLYQVEAANLRAPGTPSKSGKNQQASKISWNAMKNQPLTDGQFSEIAVSGSRKVGCVVFTCRNRLKLLEMEPDDDTTADSSRLTGNSEKMDVE